MRRAVLALTSIIVGACNGLVIEHAALRADDASADADPVDAKAFDAAAPPDATGDSHRADAAVAPSDAARLDAAVDAGPSPWESATPTPRPSAWPSARAAATMIYDESRDRVVLYGGFDGTAGLDDLWEWDPAQRTWTDRTPNPRPSAWPSARSSPGATYDSARKRMVLFGGSATNHYDEVWEYDGATGTFENRTPSPRSVPWPMERNQIRLAYDVARERSVMFAGNTWGTPQDTWEWNGEAGTWADRSTDASPPWSIDYGFVYDPTSGALVFIDPTSTVWEWNGAAGQWTPKTPSPLPSSWPSLSVEWSAVFFASVGRVAVFGGRRGGPPPNETFVEELWSYQPPTASWTQYAASVRPTPWPTGRAYHSAVYDSARSKMVVFGGQVAPHGGSVPALTDELWILDLAVRDD